MMSGRVHCDFREQKLASCLEHHFGANRHSAQVFMARRQGPRLISAALEELQPHRGIAGRWLNGSCGQPFMSKSDADDIWQYCSFERFFRISKVKIMPC